MTLRSSPGRARRRAQPRGELIGGGEFFGVVSLQRLVDAPLAWPPIRNGKPTLSLISEIQYYLSADWSRDCRFFVKRAHGANSGGAFGSPRKNGRSPLARSCFRPGGPPARGQDADPSASGLSDSALRLLAETRQRIMERERACKRLRQVLPCGLVERANRGAISIRDRIGEPQHRQMISRHRSPLGWTWRHRAAMVHHFPFHCPWIAGRMALRANSCTHHPCGRREAS